MLTQPASITQRHSTGAGSGQLRFLNNRIYHSIGNGLYFRAAMKAVKISGNIVVDPAAGPALFWVGWKAAIFIAGPTTDLDISGNRLVDDRIPIKIPYGIYGMNDITGSCTAIGNSLIDGSGHSIRAQMLQRDGGIGSWDLKARQ
jgi:hypothetical protein